MADVDPDIVENVTAMNECLKSIEARVQTPLLQLDEDAVASNYSLDDQAKIALAAAFTLIMSYYSLKRLRNDAVDPQLKLKIERVSEYVKKIRELNERERLKLVQVATGEVSASSSTEGSKTSNKESNHNSEGEPAPKKSRVDKEATDRLVKNVVGVNQRLTKQSDS